MDDVEKVRWANRIGWALVIGGIGLVAGGLSRRGSSSRLRSPQAWHWEPGMSFHTLLGEMSRRYGDAITLQPGQGNDLVGNLGPGIAAIVEETDADGSLRPVAILESATDVAAAAIGRLNGPRDAVSGHVYALLFPIADSGERTSGYVALDATLRPDR